MDARAQLRHVRLAPRKVRVILDAIRNKPVELALAQLRMADRKAAGVVYKLVASAVANTGLDDSTELFVKEAWADQGPPLRRFRPRAMGRATRIQKKTSHVTVVVADQ